MSRIGKIARLPEQVREQVNHRLQDGQNGQEILTWLNSMDEVKTVLAQGFAGREITESNLSDWRLGGYRDWEAQQIALEEARRVMSEGRELAETGDKALADNLAAWITGRYIVATRKLMESGDDEKAWKMLRELCHDVVALRRGDHGAEWLRLERERLKLQRKKQQSDREKLKQEILKENPPPEILSDEEKERRWDEIFGIDRNTHPMYNKNKNRFDPEPEPADPPPPPPEAAKLAEIKTDEAGSAPIVPIPPINPISQPQDPEALELQNLTAAAEKGHAQSAYYLGVRYRDGSGVPKDLAKAREWLGKAAAQGIGGAKVALHSLRVKFGD
jgi:hypothetical protein